MAARFKLDEPLSRTIAKLFQDAGHDVETVFDEELVGAADAAVWQAAQRERRIVLTIDKGYADELKHPPGTHFGIVLFRLPRESRRGYLALAHYALEHLIWDDVHGAIVIVTPSGHRRRR